MKKITTKEFVKKSVAIHGNKYNYDCSEYLSSKDRIGILCNIHGRFNQIPSDHLAGRGCSNPLNNKTYGELYAQTIDKEEFLLKNGYNVISIWENEWKLIRKNK